jgi:hypothetical protein
MLVSISFSKFNSLMHMHMQIMQYVGLIRSSPILTKRKVCLLYKAYV